MDNTPLESTDFEKNRLVFEHELKSLPFPFHDIVLNNEDAKNEVFEYFLTTSLKPCKYLFLRNHFNDSEIKNGIRESNEKLPDATGIKNAVASFVGQTDFEKKVHEVVNKFYSLATSNELDRKYYCCSLADTDLHKSLNYIEVAISDFEKKVLCKSEYDPMTYAEAFAKDITAKLKKIGMTKLTEAILSDFVAKMESMGIQAASIVLFNEHEFVEKFGVSVDEAKSKYRELKRYADNYLNDYLGTITENSQDYTANHTLEYYKDEKVIPNQDLVNDTIDYFKNGEGSRLFEPLEALNLIWKQYKYVVDNWDNPEIVLNHLKNIPIDEIKKHVLLGFILKWFGGYPIIERNESNPNVGATKKAIEKEFLSYNENTPEKEYCKANSKQRKHFMKLGVAMTTAITNDIPVTEVLEGMGGSDWNKSKKKYYKFDTLFKDVVDSGELGKFKDKKDFIVQKSRYEYDFMVWLQDTKSWEYGNDEQYCTFLTRENFIASQTKENPTQTTKESQSTENEEYYNKPYNGLFAVSEQKRIFRIKKGLIKQLSLDETNEYDLLNFNTYDEHTDELLEVGVQYKYNRNFFSKLIKVDPLKVDEFLGYHYSKTTNKSSFIKHLNLVVLTNKLFETNYKAIKKAVKKWIKENNRITTTHHEETNTDKVIKSKKDTLWFRTGVLFADGTMDKYWNKSYTDLKNEFTTPRIAKEVGLPKAEKYMLATFKDYKGDKNIFNSTKKTDMILDHLKKENIVIVESFKEKIPTQTI